MYKLLIGAIFLPYFAFSANDFTGRDIDLGNSIYQICYTRSNDPKQRSFSDTLIRLSCRTYTHRPLRTEMIDRDPLAFPDYDECIGSQYAHRNNALAKGWTHKQINFMGFHALRFRRSQREIPFMRYISERNVPDAREFVPFTREMVDHYKSAHSYRHHAWRFYDKHDGGAIKIPLGCQKTLFPTDLFEQRPPYEASTEAGAECVECQAAQVAQAASITDQIKSLKDRVFNFFLKKEEEAEK